MASIDTLPADRFLTLPAVIALTTMSRANIERRIRTGGFPRPVAISPRRRAWSEIAVRTWMAHLQAGVPAAEAAQMVSAIVPAEPGAAAKPALQRAR